MNSYLIGNKIADKITAITIDDAQLQNYQKILNNMLYVLIQLRHPYKWQNKGIYHQKATINL